MADPDAPFPTRSREAPLRSSEALVRGFFDASPMLMGLVEIVDGDIRHVYGNAAAASFHGVSPESLRGRTARELGHPENVIRDWIHHYRQSERIGGRVRFGYEMPRPEGPRALSVTVAPAPAPPGAPPRFAYIIEDVTERQPIEEAARLLVEPPELPAAANNVVVDSIADVFFAVDRDWRFTYANRQAERTFLRHRADFIGRNVWQVFPRAVGTLFETECRRAMDEGVTIRFEEYSPTFDAWFEAHVYPKPDGLTVFMSNITDRKRAEEERNRLVVELEAANRELAASREDLNRAQVVAQTGSWRLDVRHGEMLWSGETYRMFGIPPGTPQTYEGFMEKVHPEDRAHVDAAWKAALTGAPYDIEHRIIVNGAEKWVRERAELDFDADGSLRSGFGTVQDVTERKRTEQALIKSERRYRFMSEASPQIVWTAEPNGLLDDFNGRLTELTGLSPEEVAGTQWQNIVHPEEGAEMAAAWADCVQTGEPFLMEHRIRHRDGTYRWFMTRALPLRDDHGRIEKWFGSTMDIDERKAVEQALKQSEERFRQLADAMPQLVWTAEPDGSLDYVNRRVSEFQGLHLEHGRWWWGQLAHPEDAERTERTWMEAVLSGATYQIEHRLRCSSGAFGWYLSRAIAYRDHDGRIEKWYGTSTDIHELKEAEAALAEMDRARDRFVATLAHELRNPLSAAVLALRAMEITGAEEGRTGEWSGEHRYGPLISRQLTTITHLVNDLLDVARIKEGKIVLRRESVALASIVEQAVETARPLIEENRLALEVQLPKEPIWLDADPLRLAQVVGNLLNNAAKYTEPGGLIRVTAEAEVGMLVLRVKDTGIGIAPDLLPHVFDLFAQADAADRRVRGGLGLGLTLVRQLVALHGGSVEAESDGPGRGSTFTVRIPLA